MMFFVHLITEAGFDCDQDSDNNTDPPLEECDGRMAGMGEATSENRPSGCRKTNKTERIAQLIQPLDFMIDFVI